LTKINVKVVVIVTEFCPRDALVMSQEINAKGYTLAAVADESKCLGCGLCEVICPNLL
jgi:NAD-dependent dihydropyrimidine dehydrogenase PreA subunit